MPRTDEQRAQARRARDARLSAARERSLSAIKDAYASAKHFRETHAHLMARLATIRETDAYRRMTQHDRAHVEGYAHALHDFTYRYDLEWCLQLPSGEWTNAQAFPFESGICRTGYQPDGAYFWVGTDKQH